jgi:site-specific recombinase XerC
LNSVRLPDGRHSAYSQNVQAAPRKAESGTKEANRPRPAPHTFPTEAGRHSQNVRALQKLAGHSKIETTMRYVRPDEADVLEIASAVHHARANKGAVTTVFTTVDQQKPQEARKM